MRVAATFIAVLGLGALGCATAQARPTLTPKPAKPSDGRAVAPRKAPPSFIVTEAGGAPLDLSRRSAAPAVAFAPARPTAAKSPRADDPTFALSPAGAYGDANLMDANRYYDGRGAVSWRSNAFVAGQDDDGRVVDTVRVSTLGVARQAQTTPLMLVRPDTDAYETQDVDVTVTRGWPAAVKLDNGRYALDVTPHAGLGFGGAGGSAEAGATVRFGKSMQDRVVSSLGVTDGRAFGDRGRWYMFAAASGQAVGLNMLRSQDGDWSRAGFSTDNNSKLIGDRQAGVAWRKGAMQASFGYVHRSIKAKDQIMGMATQKDEMVAFSFSLKPHW
ncbi:MAG: DUF2219 family protein [Caulobacter sp.]|nr:DUF2219 family protein [Caulobacter sp.]